MMGWPMAMNLAEAGYTVRAYDINPAALEMVREAGVQSAFGPEDVAGALKLIKGG